MKNMSNIRNQLAEKLSTNDLVKDKTGTVTIEIRGESFECDEQTLFGNLNTDYASKELDWYKSKSRNVYDMPNPPAIWKSVSDKDGFINSNYGWCIYSEENGYQFKNTLRELRKNKDSRRAEMIYTRPSMHSDYNVNGMSDFMCTNAVTFSIRNDVIECYVQMRSNDSIFGFKNDLFWHEHVLNEMYDVLREDYPELKKGNVFWNSTSLHVYESHFYLVYHYSKTGEITITKKKFVELYADKISELVFKENNTFDSKLNFVDGVIEFTL